MSPYHSISAINATATSNKIRIKTDRGAIYFFLTNKYEDKRLRNYRKYRQIFQEIPTNLHVSMNTCNYNFLSQSPFSQHSLTHNNNSLLETITKPFATLNSHARLCNFTTAFELIADSQFNCNSIQSIM